MTQNLSINNNEQNNKMQMSELKQNEFLGRILERDESLWDGFEASAQIVKGLEWLETALQILHNYKDVQIIAQEFKKKSYKSIVVIGMGGSSVTKQIFVDTKSKTNKQPELIFINSILIAEITATTSLINYENALFLVISGSGETIETRQIFEYFWDQAKTQLLENAKDHFVIITAHNSPLCVQALDKGLQRLFYFSGNLWGRFRALGMPGLLPAVLADIDIEQFAYSVHDAAEMLFNHESIENNNAVQLGVKLSTLYQGGKNKIIIYYPEQLSGIAEWISELVAESTSKNGKGFISILGTFSGSVKIQKDSIYILLGDGDAAFLDKESDYETDQVILLKEVNSFQVGREIVRWGLAILTFCYLNRINPFVEPQFNELMSQLKENLVLTKSDSLGMYAQNFEDDLLKDLLLDINKDAYFTIQVFFSIDEPARKLIHQIRNRIQDKFKIPCIVCFGTKYMHSIGQQFKGGPNYGLFLQLIASSTVSKSQKGNRDILAKLEVTLNTLLNSEYEILMKHNRRVVKLDIGSDTHACLSRIFHLVNNV